MRNGALALLLLACAGCARCGGKSAATAEELLPKAGALAVATGPLGAVAAHLSALGQRAAAVPGGEIVNDVRGQLAGQLGFDLLTREGQLAAGLDPDRAAAAVASLPDGPAGRPAWIAALPLTSPDKFSAALDKTLRERAGMPLRTEEARGDVKVAVFSRSAEPGPRVAYAIVRGYGVLARGADPATAIAAAIARPREESLAAEASFAALRAGPAASDLLAFAPAGSALGSRLAGRPLAGDTSITFAIAPGQLQARVHAKTSPEQAQRIAALLPGGGGELLTLLPPDAPLQARLGFKPGEVAAHLERAPFLQQALAALREEVKAKGVDLDRDLFGSLKPGAVVSLASAPHLELWRVVDLGFLDWRSRSPFEMVQLAALAEVADKAALLKALDAVAQALPKVGASAARSGDDWQVTYAGGAGARFGVREVGGKVVAYLAGGGIAPEELQPHPQAQRPAALAGDKGASVSVDLGRLAAALRALPDSTYGSGPQSFLARSLAERVIEPMKLLRAALQVEPAEGGFAAALTVEIAPPAP